MSDATPSSGSPSSPTEMRRKVSWADESSPHCDDSSQYRLRFLVLHEHCLCQERLYGIENGDSFGTASLARNVAALTFHSSELDCSLLSLALLAMIEGSEDRRPAEAKIQIISDTLSTLRMTLRDSREVKTTGTLAASMCLLLYEPLVNLRLR